MKIDVYYNKSIVNVLLAVPEKGAVPEKLTSQYGEVPFKSCFDCTEMFSNEFCSTIQDSINEVGYIEIKVTYKVSFGPERVQKAH